MIIGSILFTGLTFFIISKFINNPGVFQAFRMEQISVYASLVFISLIYAPISEIFGIFTNIMSRTHEFEADRFAIRTHKKPESLISALKKLSSDNLANLTPHPLKVFLEYSHPPLLQRIQAIKSVKI
jgi:STE24 endopeptidase